MCLTDVFEQEHPVGEGNDENRGRTGFAIVPLGTCTHTQGGKEVRRCGASAGTLPNNFGQEAKNCLPNVGGC